ncbi:hypothetical protein FGG08_005655 [Glutinoglossum americanum]|uniref:Uncharacterized protein n=1 Tax=Glutinoglossum americanum TaxID=1670608 RepID=A0A9P8L1M3_9PEZI|nr:hypothetical protein FGG08_005655 [Glutinoglossum americanum]
MPVTIKPSPQLVGQNGDPAIHSAEELLEKTSRAWTVAFARFGVHTNKKIGPEIRPILQSSFGDLGRDSSVIPYGNGFVNGIIRAFEQDLHLVLRPDDIWLSIITQFSTFVNANTELLRGYFVTHEGKKDLVIDISPLPVRDVDAGKLAQEMTRLIHKDVVDQELRDWIIPNFSTTDDSDKSVASMVMMATLQNYYEYTLRGGCGFPSVTLLGEKSDWEEILRRVQRLPKYGDQTTEWNQLLVPIIKCTIATFDQPESRQIKDFWLRACHSTGRDGSGGVRSLSGWLTAFCFWGEDGKRIRSFTDEELEDHWSGASLAQRKKLVLDGVTYPIISPKSIPKGVVSVPVTVQDLESGLEHKTTMVAGSVGMTAVADSPGKIQTKVQPRSGWWVLEDSVKPILGFERQQAGNQPAATAVPSGTDFDDCALTALS